MYLPGFSSCSAAVHLAAKYPYGAVCGGSIIAMIVAVAPQPVKPNLPQVTPLHIVVPVVNIPLTIDKPLIIKGTNFKFDSTHLTNTGVKDLQLVIMYAAKNPTSNFVITGFTDNFGSHKYNQKLSTNRAKSVKLYLVKHGIDQRRIITSGKGETNPIANNSTSDGRALNRRVEIYSIPDSKVKKN